MAQGGGRMICEMEVIQEAWVENWWQPGPFLVFMGQALDRMNRLFPESRAREGKSGWVDGIQLHLILQCEGSHLPLEI